MRRTIITHVGTSLLSNPAWEEYPPRYPGTLSKSAAGLGEAYVAAARTLREGLYKEQPAPDEGKDPPLNDNFDRIRRIQVQTWLATECRTDNARYLSAELASLRLVKPAAGDSVHLIASDTMLGWLCAATVRDLLLELDGIAAPGVQFSASREPGKVYVAPIRRIEGLEVKPKEERKQTRFLDKGIPNYIGYVNQLFNELEDGDELLFNVTGGYKAVVPFATLLAMLLGAKGRRDRSDRACSVCYLYEESSSIITIPALIAPITISDDALGDYQNVFTTHSDGYIGADAADQLPPQVRDVYLKEVSQGHYSRAPEAEILCRLIGLLQ